MCLVMRWRQPNAGLARTPSPILLGPEISVLKIWGFDRVNAIPSSRWFGTFCQRCHRLLQTDSRYTDSPSGTPAKRWLTSTPRCKTCRSRGPAAAGRMLTPCPDTTTAISALPLRNWQLLRMAVTGFSYILCCLSEPGKQRALTIFSFF